MFSKMLIIGTLFIMQHAYASNNEILLFGIKEQIFTNKYRLKNSYKIRYFLIDGGRDYERKISKGLSANPTIALQQAKKLFASDKEKWAREAKKAWQGAINAQSIGINKIPAITFDNGNTVIYGVLDLIKAYKIWTRWNNEYK